MLKQPLRVLIFSLKFFTSEVAIYLFKSMIWPCMKYCFHVDAGAPSFSWEVTKWVYGTVCLSLADFLQPLDHCWSLSFVTTLVDVQLKWLNLFHFFILVWGLLVILTGCSIFLSPFLDIIRMTAISFLAPWLDCGILSL